jgi:hypothetical protein
VVFHCSPPRRPQATAPRLPPILRRRGLAPRPGCSKAPRGLFVLSRVTRIFTGTSISPSPPSRQCSSRYAFRAGRNLPDKEFRYLRTVIVTAAVHRCFSSALRTRLPLTFRHWAGISPYTAACAVAETCVFGKQSLEPASCGPLTPTLDPGVLLRRPQRQRTLPGRPFSRSYGANLPSSLTKDRSSTLRCLPLPTSGGLRYGPSVTTSLESCPSKQTARGFSGQPGHHVPSATSSAAPRALQGSLAPGFAWAPPSEPEPALSIWPADLACCVPPLPVTHGRGTVYPPSIAYAATSLGLGPG